MNSAGADPEAMLPLPRRRVALRWACVLLPVCALLQAEDAPADRTLEAAPSRNGAFTHWLASPALSRPLADAAKPPEAAREGAPLEDGLAWSLKVSPYDFVNLNDRIEGVRSGFVWCAGRLSSASGGRRSLTAHAFGAVKVFVGGKLVLDKPDAPADRTDQKSTTVELPKGETEIAVAAGIRWGHCSFALTLFPPDKTRPDEGDRMRVPLAQDKAPDRAAILEQTLTFSAGVPFVSEGKPYLLEVAPRGGWPVGHGALTVRFFGPDGAELPWKGEACALDELAARPASVRTTAPTAANASFTVRCELRDAAGQLAAQRSLTLYSLAGIKAEHAKRAEALAQARETSRAPLPNAALAVEKLSVWFEKLQSGEERPGDKLGPILLGLLGDARRFTEEEAAGKDPFAGRTGYFERAYWSAIDASPQPYFVLVPGVAKEDLGKPKEEAKKYPLVVFLHGYVPEYHLHRWWTKMPEFNAHFERHGAFLAVPFGRSNADFLGPGEVDVLEVLERMKRDYPIDPDRVYLYGYSMGGMGVYSLGGHHPDSWAAGVVIAGRADSPLLMGTKPLDKLHPFKQFLIRTDQPIDLCENFVNIPMRIYHGSEDQFINPSEAARMEARLKEIGCDAKLEVLPGNHWFGFDLMSEEAPVTWLLEQKRIKDPKVRWLKNYSLRFGKMEELSVGQISGDLKPFDLIWGQKEKSITFLRWEGPIACATVNLKGNTNVQLPENKKDVYEESGHGLFMGQVAIDTGRTFSLKGLELNSGGKFSFRCGPVKEATYGPFLIVYGTGGSEWKTDVLKKRAEDFADWWWRFAKGRATVKADKDLSGEEKTTKNLFLFGDEKENLIHATAAATGKLPIQVSGEEVKIGEKTYALQDRGLMYIHPNPLEGASPSSSLVICCGVPYGKNLPDNHKLDLVPDFILYSKDEDTDGTHTNRPVCAGFFDGKWKLDQKLTWHFE